MPSVTGDVLGIDSTTVNSIKSMFFKEVENYLNYFCKTIQYFYQVRSEIAKNVP